MFNDAPSSMFGFWKLWFGKLSRPHRLDDESCPEEFPHIGTWTWRYLLEERYGKENVSKVTNHYMTADKVYQEFYHCLLIPCPSDSCYYLDKNGVPFCNKSCAMK